MLRLSAWRPDPGPFLSCLRTAAFSGRGDDGSLQPFQVLVWQDVNGEWRDADSWIHRRAASPSTHSGVSRISMPPAIGAEIDRFEETIPFLRFDPAAQDEFLE